MEIKEIIAKAFKATDNSYSPYSNFKVGACIEMKDNNYGGANAASVMLVLVGAVVIVTIRKLFTLKKD